ncbi:YraN family protein [Asticcacaulis sp. EMRT-3]|uniref:YraN family protein n=1 Tax=Asticcacaulis sp. EMRT-3 TaxID=3040349 RepID=UPI0024AF8F18|nr:YraN family protein [Asticcacaulis sp. EMRT-3]MDI7775984.1 YraN family protein [Asticcacaulis sp. EMRT-3]
MKPDRQARGRKAHKSGHLAEYVALIHLLLKGYRILGFRLKTPQGEIDLLAQKGRRLCVVEVKQRRSHEEALETVSFIQQERLWQAGLTLQAKRPRLQHLDLNIDLYTLAPGHWPRHLRNAFEKPDGYF